MIIKPTKLKHPKISLQDDKQDFNCSLQRKEVIGQNTTTYCCSTVIGKLQSVGYVSILVSIEMFLERHLL